MVSSGERHNHATDSGTALRYRRVGSPARARLTELLRQHHSVAAALETLRAELQAEHGDRYPLVAVDRSVLPDKRYAYE